MDKNFKMGRKKKLFKISLIHIGHNYRHAFIKYFLNPPFARLTALSFSPIMPDEVREHLIRDQRPFLHPESLQIFRFTASSLQVLFSSPHSFSTGFRSEDWNGQQKLGFVPSDPFLCCFWGLCLDYCTVGDPNMAHYKISNRVSHLLIFYLLVFDRIHDAMCLNKMSRTSSRNIGPQHQKYSSIFHCTHGVLFIPVFTKPILSVCC